MYRAVIFDLFGTLVPNLHPIRYRETQGAVAAVLGVDAGAFLAEWQRGFEARMDGRLQDGDAQFHPLLEALGAPIREAAVREANELRRRFLLESLTPKPDALRCLGEIRRRQLKLALATDCSSETPSLLDRTPLGEFFGVRAVSAHLGVRKPHPRMYLHVLEQLQVRGEECVYVGDGNSEELVGARRMGMRTVWVDNGEEQHWRERFSPEGEHTVRALEELIPLLDRLLGQPAG